MDHGGRQAGQSTVELVALLPALVLVVLIGWQVVVAAHTWTVAGGAARAGARAQEVGAPYERAARGVLPTGAARRAEVAARAARAGTVRVRVELPVRRVLGWVPTVTVAREASTGQAP